MNAKMEDITGGFTKVDQTKDPRFFIEFLDARKTVKGEREVNDLIIELLGLKPGAQVLDVGCGTGDDAREMAAIVGGNGRVDPSETLITESKSRAASSGLRIEFMVGDVRNLDFPEASFDRLHAPYKTFRRVFDGFLASAVTRGQLVETEISQWLGDLAALDAAGLFNNGVIVFTASGEKSS